VPVLFFETSLAPAGADPGRARPGMLIEIDGHAVDVIASAVGGGEGVLGPEHLAAVRLAIARGERWSDLRLLAEAIERHGRVRCRVL